MKTRLNVENRTKDRVSLFRYLFPNIAARATTRLDNFRLAYLPGLKDRTQSHIHRHILSRQERRTIKSKSKRTSTKPSRILSLLKRRSDSQYWGFSPLKDAEAAEKSAADMASYATSTASGTLDQLRSEGREPGARRKKLAGYLKAANELRHSYMQGGDNSFAKDGSHEASEGAFPDAAVVRHGGEEMILFPSYGREHVKSKVRLHTEVLPCDRMGLLMFCPKPPTAEPGTIQEVPGTGRDYRDTVGAGDAEFWKAQWERHEDDRAIVDVDVRGWIYCPHRGPTTRKQRLMIGLARQLSGIPAPPATKSADSSVSNSRSSSPAGGRRVSAQEEELVAKEAEHILRKGEAEADIAGRGGFSEKPGKRFTDTDSLYSNANNSNERLSHVRTNDSDSISISEKRSSWTQSGKMSSAELAVANAHLLTRLKPFMANPLAGQPISAFFYNDTISRQRTVYTDASGHFSFRAALDFVPTSVRVLGGENLSATEAVNITQPHGVSLISDIDDTIKHSAISAGAREIFRNAFTRNLEELTVPGVKEWYTSLAQEHDVKLHYVSNSPWQMYPVLTSFFKLAGLPPGSFHLKQYTGMLQGIFEPVAERKKSSLDKLMRDFPDRRFFLVGDSGEADLEVYTDVVLDNPGRILGVFIRDVTTSPKTGYFDPSNGGSSGSGVGSGSKRHSRNHSRHRSGDSLNRSKRLSRPDNIRDDDADLRAAIAASLQDMEEEARIARSSINPDRLGEAKFGHQRRGSGPAAPEPHGMMQSPEHEDLIDFGQYDDVKKPEDQSARPNAARASTTSAASLKPTPNPPPKPSALRSVSPSAPLQRTISGESDSSAKQPPPRPRKPSSAVKPPAPIETDDAPPVPKPLTKQRKGPPSPGTLQTQQSQISNPSPLREVQGQHSPTATSATKSPEEKQKPPLPSRPKGYRETAKDAATRAYNNVPSYESVRDAGYSAASYAAHSLSSTPDTAPAIVQQGQQMRQASNRQNSYNPGTDRKAPLPPPPRRAATGNTTPAQPSALNPFRSNGPRLNSIPTPSSSLASNFPYPTSTANTTTSSFTHQPAPLSSYSYSQNSSSSSTPAASPGEAVSRKEAMWKQRLARARTVMEERGVVLRTWREGWDLKDLSVRLVREEERRIEREGKRGKVVGG